MPGSHSFAEIVSQRAPKLRDRPTRSSRYSEVYKPVEPATITGNAQRRHGATTPNTAASTPVTRRRVRRQLAPSRAGLSPAHAVSPRLARSPENLTARLPPLPPPPSPKQHQANHQVEQQATSRDRSFSNASEATEVWSPLPDYSFPSAPQRTPPHHSARAANTNKALQEQDHLQTMRSGKMPEAQSKPTPVVRPDRPRDASNTKPDGDYHRWLRRAEIPGNVPNRIEENGKALDSDELHGPGSRSAKIDRLEQTMQGPGTSGWESADPVVLRSLTDEDKKHGARQPEAELDEIESKSQDYGKGGNVLGAVPPARSTRQEDLLRSKSGQTSRSTKYPQRPAEKQHKNNNSSAIRGVAVSSSAQASEQRRGSSDLFTCDDKSSMTDYSRDNESPSDTSDKMEVKSWIHQGNEKLSTFIQKNSKMEMPQALDPILSAPPPSSNILHNSYLMSESSTPKKILLHKPNALRLDKRPDLSLRPPSIDSSVEDATPPPIGMTRNAQHAQRSNDLVQQRWSSKSFAHKSSPRAANVAAVVGAPTSQLRPVSRQQRSRTPKPLHSRDSRPVPVGRMLYVGRAKSTTMITGPPARPPRSKRSLTRFLRSAFSSASKSSKPSPVDAAIHRSSSIDLSSTIEEAAKTHQSSRMLENLQALTEAHPAIPTSSPTSSPNPVLRALPTSPRNADRTIEPTMPMSPNSGEAGVAPSTADFWRPRDELLPLRKITFDSSGKKLVTALARDRGGEAGAGGADDRTGPPTGGSGGGGGGGSGGLAGIVGMGRERWEVESVTSVEIESWRAGAARTMYSPGGWAERKGLGGRVVLDGTGGAGRAREWGRPGLERRPVRDTFLLD